MGKQFLGIPKAIGTYATASGHFKQSLIEWSAQGNDTSTINAEHLAKCEDCQERVAKARDEFILMEASSPPNRDGVPADKNRVNKTGRSSPRYVAMISTSIG
ncbi:hypothetical protein IPM19_03170 [bacterium]|nr:MAG: hypothetical protein IPM19_03170 [bacterium]